jgi:hypothetical protein
MIRHGWSAGILSSGAMVAMLVACTSSDATEPRTGLSLGELAVGSRNDLPACDDSKESMLAYLNDEKKIVVCMSGSWRGVISRARTATRAIPDRRATGATPDRSHLVYMLFNQPVTLTPSGSAVLYDVTAGTSVNLPGASMSQDLGSRTRPPRAGARRPGAAT